MMIGGSDRTIKLELYCRPSGKVDPQVGSTGRNRNHGNYSQDNQTAGKHTAAFRLPTKPMLVLPIKSNIFHPTCPTSGRAASIVLVDDRSQLHA
jgi:hypothetical protein